jgi:hypothetical protein
MVNRDKVEAYRAKFQNPAYKRFAAETLADIDYDSFSGIANQLNRYVVSDRTNPITADFAKQVLNMQQCGFSKIE